MLEKPEGAMRNKESRDIGKKTYQTNQTKQNITNPNKAQHNIT